MEKVVVGQKVVCKNIFSNTKGWNNACKKAGINPLSAVKVHSFGYGNIIAFEELPEEGQCWVAEYFDPFVEPAESRPAVVFTCAKGPITVGCMVRRKKAYLDPNWITAIKDVGLDPEDVFKVSSCDSDTIISIGIASDQCPDVDLGSWEKMYFELVEQAQKADADGWIEWHGGECPVGGHVLVDYRMRDGTVEYLEEGVKGCKLRWGHKDWPSDIVAYRPRVKEKTEEQKLRDRLDILESGYNEEINKRMNSEREAADKIAALESQLVDERQHRMKQEGLIDRLRKVLSANGKELKNAIKDRDMFRQLHINESQGASRLASMLKSNDKIIQAMDVVVEQSRDNVKLALVLAASPEVSGDAVESLARLVRLDQNQQTNKIIGMISDRGVEQLPF